MNVLVLHGPNLNLLGERPGDPRGRSLAEVDREIRTRAAQLDVVVKTLQSNHEGVLLDTIHAERRWADGVIINPGALGATSYALRDALAAIAKPAIEVHLIDLRKAEPWRRKSVLKEVCVGQIAGKGLQSYLLALERLSKSARPSPSPNVSAVLPAKTLGRRPAAPATSRAPQKTLGRAPSRAPVSSPGARGHAGFLTRALIREKISERLSGKLSASGLATWARLQWQEVQRGVAAESGHRELLEDLLQSLLLSSLPPHQLTDDQLIDMLTRLDG